MSIHIARQGKSALGKSKTNGLSDTSHRSGRLIYDGSLQSLVLNHRAPLTDLSKPLLMTLELLQYVRRAKLRNINLDSPQRSQFESLATWVYLF